MRTINARQLFLLCILRKEAVEANNLKEYLWTIRHDTYKSKKLAAVTDLPEREERNKAILSIEHEAREKYQTQKHGFRKFVAHDLGFGEFDLSDQGNDMAWYMPGQKNDWEYHGQFELTKPLSKMEEFLLFDFLGIEKHSKVFKLDEEF